MSCSPLHPRKRELFITTNVRTSKPISYNCSSNVYYPIMCLHVLHNVHKMNECWRSHVILQVKVKVMLWLTVSQPVCLGIKHPSGAYDQNFINVRQLQSYWCGWLSLMRGRVCHLQLLLSLTSAVILGYESHGTRDQILLSQIRDFPFHCLLQLAGLQWRYSTLPPHRKFLQVSSTKWFDIF
jgi:hypothetical protein